MKSQRELLAHPLENGRCQEQPRPHEPQNTVPQEPCRANADNQHCHQRGQNRETNMTIAIFQSDIATIPAFWHAIAAIGSVAIICATITLLTILYWAKIAISSEANLQIRRWRHRKLRLPTQNVSVDYPTQKDSNEKTSPAPSQERNRRRLPEQNLNDASQNPAERYRPMPFLQASWHIERTSRTHQQGTQR